MIERDYKRVERLCESLKFEAFYDGGTFREDADQPEQKGFATSRETLRHLQEARAIARAIMRYCEFLKKSHPESAKNCDDNQPTKGDNND